LIVNADDFGLTEGVNRAVLATHTAGALTSTTLMVSMPAADQAMALAAEAPGLAVGWHANLSLGRPLRLPEEVPTLVDREGRFHPRAALERRLLLGRVAAADIRRELEAQFTRFLAWGRRPSHVDSHQHLHAFPLVFDALAELATREGLPMRLPWRWPGPSGRDVRPGAEGAHAPGLEAGGSECLRLGARGAESPRLGGLGWRRRLRALGLEALVARNERRWAGRLRTNSGFCSLFDLTDRPEAIGTALYERLLGVYRGGLVELMVHPAEVDEDLRAATRITRFSAKEYAWLLSGALPRLATRLGMGLTDYRALI